MKKRIVLASASVALTLGLASLTLFGRGFGVIAHEEGEVALGASLDHAPVPVVDVAAVSYDLSAHQTLSRVILLIRENYVDPARIKPYEMFLSALTHIQKTVPEVLVDDREAPRRIKVAVGAATQSFELGGLDQLWEVTMALRDIFRFLQQHITDYDQRREVEYAAINGMLATLDPHSVLLKPESFDEVKLSTKGEFGGLGIVISVRDGSLTIISPIEGTPASRSGLRAKDVIVKIGEESTVNMGLEEAVHRLRGKPGTKVVIWIKRKGWSESRRFQLTRAIIKIESVTSELLQDGIGYVRIKSFQNNTYDDLRSHLERLRRKNRGELRGVVLDLRNNPGGLLDQAIHVSDRFIDRGPIVITVGEGNRKREVKQARFSGTETEYPIVVLVNAGSASASEIVSGALQNHNRAVVIGQQTFGKGSVQVLYDFKDRSALKLTIAQYLTPGDVSIQSVGITPDIEIVPVTVSKGSIHLFGQNHSPREKDLKKHLDRHGTSEDRPSNGPVVRINHFMSREELEGGPRDADESIDKFDYDFETQIAHDMLVLARGLTDREKIIEKASPLFNRRASEAQTRIVSELESLGVDWSAGVKASGTPHSEVTLTSSAGADRSIGAGETLTLTASVFNTGDAPLYRVFAITESDNPLLGSREFALGKVAPGEKRSWDVEVKIPDDINTRGDRVTLTLGDEHGDVVASAAPLFVTMRAQKQPRFSYIAWISDERGNGDGMLQKGESVVLKVEVTNNGPGPAKDVVITAKNLSGESVFLEAGRDGIGELPIGKSKVGELRFTVRRSVESVRLRLALWDNELGSAISEKLTLPVISGQRRIKENRRMRVKPGHTASIYSGADASATVIGSVKSGTLLRSDAMFASGWRRTEIEKGRLGYLRAEDLIVLRGGARNVRNGALSLLPGQSSPRLLVEIDEFVTSNETLRIRGVISDDHAPKDFLVFVNDKKVHYQALGGAGADADGDFSLPFDLTLPLKAGSNAIALMVRETDELVSRRVFGVYRDHPRAVAERDEDLRPKHQ